MVELSLFNHFYYIKYNIMYTVTEKEKQKEKEAYKMYSQFDTYSPVGKLQPAFLLRDNKEEVMIENFSLKNTGLILNNMASILQEKITWKKSKYSRYIDYDLIASKIVIYTLLVFKMRIMKVVIERKTENVYLKLSLKDLIRKKIFTRKWLSEKKRKDKKFKEILAWMISDLGLAMLFFRDEELKNIEEFTKKQIFWEEFAQELKEELEDNWEGAFAGHLFKYVTVTDESIFITVNADMVRMLLDYSKWFVYYPWKDIERFKSFPQMQLYFIMAREYYINKWNFVIKVDNLVEKLDIEYPESYTTNRLKKKYMDKFIQRFVQRAEKEDVNLNIKDVSYRKNNVGENILVIDYEIDFEKWKQEWLEKAKKKARELQEKFKKTVKKKDKLWLFNDVIKEMDNSQSEQQGQSITTTNDNTKNIKTASVTKLYEDITEILEKEGMSDRIVITENDLKRNLEDKKINDNNDNLLDYVWDLVQYIKELNKWDKKWIKNETWFFLYSIKTHKKLPNLKYNSGWDIRQALSHIPSVSYNANELTEEEIDRIMNEN